MVVDTTALKIYFLAAGDIVTQIPTAGSSTPSYAFTSKIAGYTEVATSGDLYRECTLIAGFTVMLPVVAGNSARFTYKKGLAAGQITIQANGAETIDGANTAVLNNLGELFSVSPNAAGTGWDIS